MPFDGSGSSSPAMAAVIEMERLLRERGWIKRRLESHAGLCLIGALNVATFGVSAPIGITPTTSPAQRLARDEIAMALYRRVGRHAATNFNDHPRTTIDDVFELLSDVRADLAAKEAASANASARVPAR